MDEVILWALCIIIIIAFICGFGFGVHIESETTQKQVCKQSVITTKKYFECINTNPDKFVKMLYFKEEE